MKTRRTTPRYEAPLSNEEIYRLLDAGYPFTLVEDPRGARRLLALIR